MASEEQAPKQEELEQAGVDSPDQAQPSSASESAAINGYRQRQCGCLWILMLIGGIFHYISFYLVCLNQTGSFLMCKL